MEVKYFLKTRKRDIYFILLIFIVLELYSCFITSFNLYHCLAVLLSIAIMIALKPIKDELLFYDDFAELRKGYGKNIKTTKIQYNEIESIYNKEQTRGGSFFLIKTTNDLFKKPLVYNKENSFKNFKEITSFYIFMNKKGIKIHNDSKEILISVFGADKKILKSETDSSYYVC